MALHSVVAPQILEKGLFIGSLFFETTFKITLAIQCTRLTHFVMICPETGWEVRSKQI